MNTTDKLIADREAADLEVEKIRAAIAALDKKLAAARARANRAHTAAAKAGIGLTD